MSKKVWCLFGVHEFEIIKQAKVDHYLESRSCIQPRITTCVANFAVN